MLTIPAIVTHITFVTLDLQDTYFHVSIRFSHRKFLRFAFGGVAYQYRVLAHSPSVWMQLWPR